MVTRMPVLLLFFSLAGSYNISFLFSIGQSHGNLTLCQCSGNMAGAQQATRNARAAGLPYPARGIVGRLRPVQCRVLQPAFAAQCPAADSGDAPLDNRE